MVSLLCMDSRRRRFCGRAIRTTAKGAVAPTYPTAGPRSCASPRRRHPDSRRSGGGEALHSHLKRSIGDPLHRAHDAHRHFAAGDGAMMIRTYDTLSIAERERHARVRSMALNVLAKQHSMVADLDPDAVRKRSAELALVGLDASVRAI